MSEKTITPVERKNSVEDYLKLERKNIGNYEYIDGKILPMPASSRIHSLMVTNTTIAVGSRLRGQNCEVYAGNMRVQLNSERFCYPSVVIVNGKPSFTGEGSETLVNPTVVVEIFSPETRSYQKRESYLDMSSIRECLFVKEDEMRIEHYFKQNAKQWVYKIYNGRDDVISLESVNCKASVAEIYAQINFKNERQLAAA